MLKLMEYVRLGHTDLHVSRLGLGTWAYGGDWGAVELAQSKAAIRKALDLGINFFDTAQAYGFGTAELILGEALLPEITGRRHEIVLATKGGLRKHEGDQLVRDSSRAWLRHGLEASLRALGTDYVDLYQVHWPDPHTSFEETAIAMDDFVREGKVRYVGVSNFNATQMAAFEQTRRIDTAQPPYHLLRRQAEDSIFPYCERHGIGVMIYGPMAHGLLTGKYTAQADIRADDWRSRSSLFQGEELNRNLSIVAALQDFAGRREFTLGQLAVAWTLARPAVDVAIVGARTAAQIQQTAPAVDLHLSTADLGDIERILNIAAPVGGPTPETV